MNGLLAVLTILGFFVTVAGFAFTLLQLKRTKSIAIATRDTVLAATDRVRYNQLLVLLPQLQNLEPELDAAMREDDPRVAERTLVRWNQLASQTQGIVIRMGEGYIDLAEALAKSCEEAVRAKGDLVEEAGTVKDLTRGIRGQVAALSVSLGSVLGSLATEASGNTAPETRQAKKGSGSIDA